MRPLKTILAAVSALLLIVVLFFWVRSYSRYEGVLHYGESSPAMVTGTGAGRTFEAPVTGRSSGWISYRGQLTYLSIVNPIRADQSWESWSHPADRAPDKGAMVLAADARAHGGIGAGSAKTKSGLEDAYVGATWQLPYSYFTIPYWMLTVLLGLLPYVWIRSRREASRGAAAVETSSPRAPTAS